MPVLHRGYLQFFDAHSDITDVLVFDQDVLDEVDYLRKDLRALTPVQQCQALRGLDQFTSVAPLSRDSLKALDHVDAHITLPDEDVSRAIAKSFKHAKISFYPVFLRWDRSSVEALNEEAQDVAITDEQFHKDVMKSALKKAGQSSDIWRRVGAVIITKNDEKLGPVSNQGEPTSHSPWMEGDPRNIFKRGVGIEMSLFSHAEATLIAEAARRGINLTGASLYASTFPCPACAKLIAHSGITTCYYSEGYAVLDGADVLKEYGVQLIRVDMPNVDTAGPEAIPYKK